MITSAGATVIAAFAALLVASLESLRTLAPGLIVGIVLMLLAALTLVPAILSLFGITVFWPTKPVARERIHRTRSERIGDMVAKHPALVLLVWSVVLIALALGALGFKTTYNQLAELPSSTPSQVAFNTMATAFPAGYLGPTQVFVTSDTSDPLNQSDVSALADKLGKTQGVSTVLPPTYTTSKGQALIDVLLTSDPYSVTAINNVEGPVRTTASSTAVAGATTLVGGTTRSWSMCAPPCATMLSTSSLLLSSLLPSFWPCSSGRCWRRSTSSWGWCSPMQRLSGSLPSSSSTDSVSSDWTSRFPSWCTSSSSRLARTTTFSLRRASREGLEEGLSPRETSRTAIVHGAPAVAAASLILAGTFASLLLTGIQLLEEIGSGGGPRASCLPPTSWRRASSPLWPLCGLLRFWHFWWPNRTHAKTAPKREDLLPAPHEANEELGARQTSST